ncbi:MAG: PQQ-binding-like beta-propeller repeat protein [Candidatus Hydrogenedentes bacterium]|nr:PQQ-binding-like beta-propeller repeat protein [Candidatus Hydrogenedentota bacterium]
MFARIDIAALGTNQRASYMAVVAATVLSTVISITALYFWLAENPARSLDASVPTSDGLLADMEASKGPTDLSGVLVAYGGAAADLPGYWPWFRGADSSNIHTGGEPLAGAWAADGPEVLWSVKLGEGFAGPAVLNGCVYLLDYNEEDRADALRCFSLADGQELWRRSYPIMIKRNHGMSRTIPAVTEKYIITMGPRCHVVCLDTETGDFRWGIDLKKDYGTVEPLWYTGQCPIIIDGKYTVIAPAGPDVLMMAVDCDTGSPIWKTPNPHGWNMSHSSIMPMTLLGKKMFVYSALGGMTAVSAEGEDAGAILWEQPWDAKVVAPSPVQIEENRIFMTAGYGKGSMMLELSEEKGKYSVQVLFETTPEEGLACEQQTPLYYKGLLYGIMPKDAGALKGQFVCYRPDGSLFWSSGQDNRFGLGPFLLADDKFFLLDDDGVLTVLDANKGAYTQLSQMRVIEGHDAWGPMAVAGTRLLMRDMNNLVCIEIGARGAQNV